MGLKWGFEQCRRNNALVETGNPCEPHHMGMKGVKLKGKQQIRITVDEMRLWRKNVAHLLLTGKKRAQNVRDRIKAQNKQSGSSTVRVSCSRVALVRKLAAKHGVTMRDMMEHIIDKFIS